VRSIQASTGGEHANFHLVSDNSSYHCQPWLLTTGGENHGNVCKLRGCDLDHGFRLGRDVHGACRTSNSQLWRLTCNT